MAEQKKWHYCVVGNIVKTHFDENGVLRYGTSAFSGGTKVYLCGKAWDFSREDIPVIGLSRGRKFQVHDVPVNLIENVRCRRAFNPAVLEIMDDFEFSDYWWKDTEADRENAEAFVANWNHEERKT